VIQVPPITQERVAQIDTGASRPAAL